MSADATDNHSIYPQQLWNTTYSCRDVVLAGEGDPIVRLIRQTVPPTDSGEALEIGCCPGTYLGHFALMGYRVHGMDLSPSVYQVRDQYTAMGLRCGQFAQKDFFVFFADRQQTYDVVSSFGFIEHFDNFEEVFLMHCKLVKSGGYLVVCFPNFVGDLQFALHAMLDRDNLQRHNTKAMHADAYTKIACSLGFRILFSGYFGGFSFWRENSGPLPSNPVMYSLYQGVQKVLETGALHGDNKTWSCFGGLVAQKI